MVCYWLRDALQLEGNFVYKAGTLNFHVKVGNSDPNSTVQIQLAFKGNSAALKRNLALVLDIDNQNKIKLSFEFELRMRWVDGVLVKDEPVPLAA